MEEKYEVSSIIKQTCLLAYYLPLVGRFSYMWHEIEKVLWFFFFSPPHWQTLAGCFLTRVVMEKQEVHCKKWHKKTFSNKPCNIQDLWLLSYSHLFSVSFYFFFCNHKWSILVILSFIKKYFWKHLISTNSSIKSFKNEKAARIQVFP